MPISFDNNIRGRALYLPALIIVAVTFATYLPSFTGDILWDDDAYLYPDKLMGLTGLYRIWFTTDIQQYYPLIHTDFWLEQHLWGMNTLPYHLGNTLLHALTGVLAWLVARKLSLRGAWLIGAIFAVHPVSVESVAWITERKNILSMLFYLAALLSYLNYEDTGSESKTGNKWYALALFLFLLALLSKIVVCTFPIALIIIRWMRGARGRELGVRYLVRLLPFFALSLIFGLITVWWETYKVGAGGGEWSMSMAGRLIIAGRALWFYIGNFVYPLDLTFIYPRYDIYAGGIGGGGGGWLFLAAYALVGVVLFMARTKITRGPFAAYLFFFITLSPMLGFLNIYFFKYSYFSDHFPYHASVGFYALAVGTAAYLLRKQNQNIKIALSVALIIILSVLSWNQSKNYADNETLWTDALSNNPRARIACVNLGEALGLAGKAGEAIKLIERCLKQWPDDDVARKNLIELLVSQKMYDEALVHLEMSIKLKSYDGTTFIRLGEILSIKGRYQEANRFFEIVVKLWPDYAPVYRNIGENYKKMGRPVEARRYLDKAAALELEEGEGN